MRAYAVKHTYYVHRHHGRYVPFCGQGRSNQLESLPPLPRSVAGAEGGIVRDLLRKSCQRRLPSAFGIPVFWRSIEWMVSAPYTRKLPSVALYNKLKAVPAYAKSRYAW